MALTQKLLAHLEKLKKKKELERKKRAKKWHEAGVKARKRNKKKRDAEKEKEKEKARKKREALREKKKLEKKKRGPGRPKKRGPKKKKKYISKKPKVDKRSLRRCDFKIVATLNGKQKEFIANFVSLEDAYRKLNELKADNEKIIFPRKVINAGVLKASKDEYLLLQKNRYGDLQSGQLRNEFGKVVEQKTNSKVWEVYDKCERLVEETFWVYGKCPKTDRQTFEWVYNNKIIGNLVDKYDIERVILFKNKIVIKHDNLPIDFIICKNMSDAIRFYNLLEEWCKKNKQVFFLGNYNKVSDKRRELEKELIELTGWDKRKIQCPSTRA